jgi:hypothetical protein
MDDMKNDMDDALRGNENRARIETAGVYNRMTPCDGSGSAVARPANEEIPANTGQRPPVAVGQHEPGTTQRGGS